MEFAEARKTMSETFRKEEDLRFAYQANVAMLLYDRWGISKKMRNQAADEILALIFDSGE